MGVRAISHKEVLHRFRADQNIIKIFGLILAFIILPGCVLPTTTGVKPQVQLDKPVIDARLQSDLEGVIETLGLNEAVHDRRLALAFADISDISHPLLAGVNETHQMYAASLPKIAILFGLLKRVEQGEITWCDEIQKKAEDMIRKSSNPASADLFHLVGADYLRQLLMSDKYKLYDREKFGGLWLGKEYGPNGPRVPDPIGGTVHGATPFSVIKFYYMMESFQLLSRDWTMKMREILSVTAYNSKFVRGLQRCCPDAVALRKAGAWRNYSSDSALVINNDKRYIITALADDPQSEYWLEDLAPHLDALAGKYH